MAEKHSAENDARPDNPHGGWFKRHHDAVHQAHFRAALVRRRYRVHYDAANRWWNIAETTRAIPPAVCACGHPSDDHDDEGACMHLCDCAWLA